MIDTKRKQRLFLLSAIAATVALCVAGYSLLDMGVYEPSTPKDLLPGAASQDVLSIVAALGVLICVILLQRGKEKLWLIWAGLVGYLFYAYALYSFDRVYNPLFLGYVAIVGLCIYSLIVFFMQATLPGRIGPKADRTPPRKAAAGLLFILAIMFLFLWLSILLPAMRTRVAPDGNAIFVMDLSFFVPLLMLEATMLLRKRPLGDALAIPLLIKMGTLGVSVMLGALLAPAFGQPLDAASIGIYALLGLGPLALAVPFMQSIRVSR